MKTAEGLVRTESHIVTVESLSGLVQKPHRKHGEQTTRARTEEKNNWTEEMFVTKSMKLCEGSTNL